MAGKKVPPPAKPPRPKPCPYCGDSGIVESSTGHKFRCSCSKGRDPN